MSANIWQDFAKLNGMNPDEFFDELIVTTMAAASMKIDEQKTNAIKLTKGDYTLIVVDNTK